MWRKHLSTADRIKVDRRNHELGLWLLDSLPKATMKEALQTVCREVWGPSTVLMGIISACLLVLSKPAQTFVFTMLFFSLVVFADIFGLCAAGYI